ncbi:hypothetical protein Pelo_4501 [Pelomyxa schiedti]|nr:hypothetical protein Pelo_4501 [Pelomyxa schiedti]
MAAASTSATSTSGPGPRVGPDEWFDAAFNGNADKLQAMLALDPGLLNSVNERKGETALHAATWGGSSQCVDFLLSVNIDANLQDVCKTFPVFPSLTDLLRFSLALSCGAFSIGGEVEIVKRLLSCVRIATNIKNKYGKTALATRYNDEIPAPLRGFSRISHKSCIIRRLKTVGLTKADVDCVPAGANYGPNWQPCLDGADINDGDGFCEKGKMSEDGVAKSRMTERVMMVSRVVWDFVVVPIVLDPTAARGPQMTRPECCWIVGLADALFPLVPRACRAIMGVSAPGSKLWWPCVGGSTRRLTSRYFALGCAGVVGSVRCVEWIVGSKRTRNNARECLTVLGGLCEGGHLALAQELVDNGNTPWRGGALRWPVVGESDLLDEIKEMDDHSTSILHAACSGGHLDVVKWVMSRFAGGVGGTEPWELMKPFQAALFRGRIDTAEWMASSSLLGVVDSCEEKIVTPHSQCAPEVFLEAVKLCIKVFGLESSDVMEYYGRAVLAKFIRNCSQHHSSGDSKNNNNNFEEGCEWIKKTFSVTEFSTIQCENSRGLMWVIKSFHVEPTQKLLSHACNKIADVRLIEWLFENFGTLSPVSFQVVYDACGNKKDSVAVVMLLLEKAKMPPTQPNLRKCLARSLSNNNTEVAEWLESKFHVMDGVNSDDDPSSTERIFSEICGGGRGNRGIGGIQWFLSHAMLRNIRETAVLSAVENCQFITFTLVLLRQFNSCISHRSSIVQRLIEDADVSQTRQIVNYGDFSSSDVAEAFSACDYVNSGKVVKWLINEFVMTEDQIKVNHNNLLAMMMHQKRVGCTEWLINQFHVKLNEITRLADNHKITSVSVGMWKMLMRVFPEMTASVVRDHFMQWVLVSPLHTSVTMKTVGLTKADVDWYINNKPNENSSDTSGSSDE